MYRNHEIKWKTRNTKTMKEILSQRIYNEKYQLQEMKYRNYEIYIKVTRAISIT